MVQEGTTSDPVEQFAERLRTRRLEAGHPSLDILERLCKIPKTTISDKLNGKSHPRWEFVEAFVRACALHSGIPAEQLDGLDLTEWRLAHRAMLWARAERRTGQRAGTEAATVLASPPKTLPPDRDDFTGRDKELHLVTTAVADAAQTGGVVAIHAIDGMPGIGKTALAVHLAWQLADQFPDGQQFLDLHAHTAGRKPTRPVDALATLLTMDGVDPRYLPDSRDDRAALWRTRMSDKRTLLVLDNAVGRDQVLSLLPGGPSLILITSRRQLGDLTATVSAKTIPLPVLPADDARLMFIRAAQPRPVRDDTDLEELVRLCGYLPLAVSILARVYRQHTTWTLTDLINETRESLLTLTAGKDTVAAAFAVSLRHMTSARRRFLTLLGQHPGTTVDPYAAAALTGTTLTEATTHLDGLYQDNLLTEVAHRRYGMHDLIRAYIRDRATTTVPADEREQAIGLLLDYYQHTATHADTFLTRHTRPASTLSGGAGLATASRFTTPHLPDQANALAWVRTERSNLSACLDQATATGQHPRVIAFTAALAGLLRQDGPWTEAITRHTTAATSAQEVNDQFEHANALTDLGIVRWLTDDYPGATELLEQALTLYQDLEDRLGQANALKSLGIVRRLTGDYPGATELQSQALTLYQDLEDRIGQANALKELGIVRRATGDYPGAAELLEQALTLYQDLEDRIGQLYALNNLGVVRRLTGDYPGAAELLQQALTLSQDLGDQFGQAYAFLYLGDVRRATGDYPGAAKLLQQAVTLSQDVGDRGGEGEALNELGTVCRLRGDLDQAAAHHRRALEVSREIGNAWGNAHALAGLARCSLAHGHPDLARAALAEALEILQRIEAAEAADVAAELDALTHRGPDGSGIAERN